jgi:pimeloyl-ACP methyl ester carboxylesterase
MTTPTVLLVHGAWHGSWCWAKVASLLQQSGINVVTVDLPGRAGDETPVEALTLERMARAVCQVARLQGRPVVVVGHSFGGMAITQAAEYEPEDFATLVYVCAFLPANGQSVRSLFGSRPGGVVATHVEMNTPRTGYSRFRAGAPLDEIFYNDCSAEDVARASAMLIPEPMAPSATPVDVSAQRFGRIPRVYVQCRRDRIIPLALQQQMCETTPCERVVSLESGHSPFLSVPAELAAILASVSTKRG